jgi:hypothetical protein
VPASRGSTENLYSEDVRFKPGCLDADGQKKTPAVVFVLHISRIKCQERYDNMKLTQIRGIITETVCYNFNGRHCHGIHTEEKTSFNSRQIFITQFLCQDFPHSYAQYKWQNVLDEAEAWEFREMADLTSYEATWICDKAGGGEETCIRMQ